MFQQESNSSKLSHSRYPPPGPVPVHTHIALTLATLAIHGYLFCAHIRDTTLDRTDIWLGHASQKWNWEDLKINFTLYTCPEYLIILFIAF